MNAHQLTVTDAAKAIRAGSLSSVDLIEALIDRIDRMDAKVQALTYVDRTGARARAAQLEKEAKEGSFRGPLHGVPFAAKDIIYSAGVPTEAGSALYRGFVPDFDATVVARLKSAGAILLGKTHTTELANNDPAPTRNPWNLKHTPGGSSSGSGAAVSAGMVPASLGTQTGGSNLRPASFCGIAGLKPSYGRVSLYGVMPLCWSLDHVGFMARCVPDLALLLQATAGADPADPTSSREPLSDYVNTRAGQPPRIGVLREFFFDEAEPDTVRVTNDALEKLARSGAHVSDVGLPQSFAVIHAAHFLVEETEIADAQADVYATRAHMYKPSIRQSVEVGCLIPGDLYVRAQRLRYRFRREIVAVMKSFDVLAMPTTIGGAPAGLLSIGSWAFQSPWSASGLPCLTIPCGLSDGGLPLGLQLVAGPFQEARLLSSGAWCEAVLGPLGMPPDLEAASV